MLEDLVANLQNHAETGQIPKPYRYKKSYLNTIAIYLSYLEFKRAFLNKDSIQSFIISLF